MINQDIELRDFIFRGLLFEAEASRFRKAGIQVGADLGQTEELLFTEALSPFNIQRRNQALEMTRLYAVLHCFENEIRQLITDTLFEKVGPNWWEKKVPRKIKNHANTIKEKAEKDSWLEGERGSLISFIEFGHLADIICDNWEYFEDFIPNQHWVKQRMDELEKVRHFIAHNRMLLPGEFERVYMYIRDWNRVIGL